MKLHRTSYFALISLLVVPMAAWAQDAKPRLAAPEVRTGKNITKAIAGGFDKQLRKELAAHAELVPAKATAAALKKAGADRCDTDPCAMKVAAATKARFVLDARITNADEIYTVELSLYDVPLKKRSVAKQVCELCAAEEVDKTIEAAVAELGPALKAEAPKIAAPAEDGKVPVELITDPEGVAVSKGETKLGQTPIVVRLGLGAHELVFQKEGYAKVTRTIQALGQPIKLNIKMEKVAVEATPPPVEPPAEPAPAPSDDSGFPYAATGWGMLIGGAALAGVGTWLIFLDGEVTCDDGRGRTQCPNVYNTKGMGVTGLGLGAGLIGAGITLLILDPSDDGGPAVSPTDDGQGAAFLYRGHW